MSEGNEGVGLFERDDGSAPGSIVFLTNRFNLLEILSSGLVTPRAAFGKYYEDFLKVAQGRIPLFQAPLSRELCAKVSSGDDSCFPVAVEIDAAKLTSTPVTALGNDGTTEAIRLEPGRAKIWAGGGAIPSVAVQKVHFRSASELEEHKLREYDNIFPGRPPLTVSPELFEKGVWAADKVEMWLASLAPVAAPSTEEFSLYDRLAGGRCLAAHTAPAESMHGLAVFFGAGGTSTDVRPVAFPPWLSADNTIRPRESGWRGKSTEERLYCSAVRVLRQMNPAEAWRPLQVLGDVQVAVAATQLPKKDEAQLLKQFAAMGAILRNEKEFKPFRLGVGSPVIKALLMTLMRPEPARLLSWPNAESGADHDVQLTAAVLAGVLQGHKRLSTNYRQPELDRLIALTSASEMCAGLRDAFRPATDRMRLTVSAQPASTEGDTTVTLMWDGLAVVSKKSRRRVLADLVGTLDVQDPAVSQVLTDVCMEQGWTDCVRSVVTTTDRNWTAAPRAVGLGLEIVVLGPVSVRVEIEKEALRERFSRASFPAAEEERLAGRLRAAGRTRATAKPGVEPNMSSAPEPKPAEPATGPSNQHPGS